MKILKTGIVPADRVYKTTCRNCSTEFEFTRSEARFVSDQRDGNALQIACPVCGKDCWVAV